MSPLIPLKELSKFRSMIDGIRPRQWRPSGGKRCETWVGYMDKYHWGQAYGHF